MVAIIEAEREFDGKTFDTDFAIPAAPKFRGHLPNAVGYDGRCSFGIEYFETEADADAAAKIVTDRDSRDSHGYPVGRDATFDHVDRDSGRQWYAVTVS